MHVLKLVTTAARTIHSDTQLPQRGPLITQLHNSS